MAAGPCAGLCGMTSAAWSRVLVRPQAVVSGAPGAECGPIRRWPGVQGLTATSEAGSGRASALLSTGLRDSGKAGVGRRNGPRAVAVCCLAVRTGRQAGRTGSSGLSRRRCTRHARFSNQVRIRPLCCTLPHSSTRVRMEYVSLMPSVSACRSTGHLHSTGRALGDRGRRARYTSVWRNPLPVRCVLSARQLGCLRRFNKAVRITGLSCSSQVRTVVGVKRCVRASRVACLGGRYGIIRARGPAPRTPALCRLWDGPPTARPAVARSFFAQERLYRKDLRTMPMCLFYDILDHSTSYSSGFSSSRLLLWPPPC